MQPAAADLVAHLLRRLREVQERLGLEARADGPDVRFAEAVDSMGLVEFVGVVAGDCGVTPEVVERAVGRRFGTVEEVAAALSAAGLTPGRPEAEAAPADRPTTPGEAGMWLLATAVGLPAARQPTSDLDALLGRPSKWLEKHAGIRRRAVWAGEDALEIAARAGRDCLERAGLSPSSVGALLVTSEAPPVLAGLAAALHHRLGLAAGVAALEVGGACTGFLAALWLAGRLLPATEAVLVLAVEAHSQWLTIRPGPAGEAAALFGDCAAACLLGGTALGPGPVPVRDLLLGTDGGLGRLLGVRRDSPGGVEICMDGLALAERAVRAMADGVSEMCGRHALRPAQLGAVVAHGGNGRMPGLLARQLGVAPERVWSETAETGNLGSASLPVAWAARRPVPGPVVWTAVGAGVQWGAALLGS
jgi:3-oxoacyl-[acyl-carrier-protein] synthase-3